MADGSQQPVPQDLDAEKCVLGCCLLNAQAWDDVSQRLKAEHFFSSSNRTIFQAISEMLSAGKSAVDTVLLGNHLQKKKLLSEIGGPAYLEEILGTVPDLSHASFYADIVREKAYRRQMIEKSEMIRRSAYDDALDHKEVVAKTEMAITDLVESQGDDGPTALMDVMMVLADTIGDGQKQGVSTGFSDLDHLCQGLHPEKLYILAARPSMGKSAMAVQIASSFARYDRPVLFFSLEMSKEELGERLISMESRIDAHKLRTGELNREDRDRLSTEQNCLSNWPLYIHDNGYLTIEQIASQCRAMKRKNKIELVVVDYLQLITASERRDSREQQVAHIARSLKLLAKSLKIPVIALAQLNRGVESRKDHIPKMSDLRESGAIEQDADQVWMMLRVAMLPDATDQDWDRVRNEYGLTGELPDVAELFIRKNRSGPLGAVAFRYDGAHVRFDQLSRMVDPTEGCKPDFRF